MSRVKRSVHAKKKRRATLERTKGFRGDANSHYKAAKEALLKADSYAYRDRRNRKRDFRRLWITRINAAARMNGMSYGSFMYGIKLAGIGESIRVVSLQNQPEGLLRVTQPELCESRVGFEHAGSYSASHRVVPLRKS